MDPLQPTLLSPIQCLLLHLPLPFHLVTPTTAPIFPTQPSHAQRRPIPQATLTTATRSNPRQLTCKAKYPQSASVSKRISHSFLTLSRSARLSALASSPLLTSIVVAISRYPTPPCSRPIAASQVSPSRDPYSRCLLSLFLSFFCLSILVFWPACCSSAHLACPRPVLVHHHKGEDFSAVIDNDVVINVDIVFTISSDSDQIGPGRNLRSLRLVPLSSQTTDFLTSGPAHLRPQPATSRAPAHTPTCEREHARQVPLTRPN